MSALYDQLIAILTRYMSGVNAHSILGNGVRNAGLAPGQLQPRDIQTLLPMLKKGINLFVQATQQQQLVSQLQALAGTQFSSSHSVGIRSEQDISQARVLAKAMCENAGAKTFVTQKVATIVSELARNIVSYTSGGTIELAIADNPRRIIIRATDNGPGIANLNEVLAGRYRSTTGLGKGLIGVQRLADRFDIKTDKSGTQVEVEVRL